VHNPVIMCSVRFVIFKACSVHFRLTMDVLNNEATCNGHADYIGSQSDDINSGLDNNNSGLDNNNSRLDDNNSVSDKNDSGYSDNYSKLGDNEFRLRGTDSKLNENKLGKFTQSDVGSPSLHPTLSLRGIPAVMQVSHIVHGYRPVDRPWRYYVYSLFRFHNETLNVWTHLIGCIVITWQLYLWLVEYWHAVGHKAAVEPAIAACVCFMIQSSKSAFAHLFHSKSRYVHYVAFMADYIGVTFAGVGVSLVLFSCADRTGNGLFDRIFIPLLFGVAYLNFVNTCIVKTVYGSNSHKIERKLIQLAMMIVHASIGIVPLIPRYLACYRESTCAISSLNHVTSAVVVTSILPAFYVNTFPECLCPGRFDIVGQSHQIFHVLGTVSEILTLRAAHRDVDMKVVGWNCKLDLATMLTAIAILYLADLLTLMAFRSYIGKSLRRKAA
jgi:predicted membrane channel-forming protein YqfA (hemolysin III family)